MKILAKAVAAGLSPANICSWLALEWMRISGDISGTLRLRLKAALLGVSLGKNVRAHGPVGLLRWPGASIRIGDGVRIISSWRRATAAAASQPARLRVFGRAVIDIGPGCELTAVSITCRSTSIVLGRNVLVAPNCTIVDSDFHAPWPPECRSQSPGMERDQPVRIGDHVWLGMNSIILKGVTIGHGAIIGAGSVVTRDVPPDTLACGNPARIVRQLP